MASVGYVDSATYGDGNGWMGIAKWESHGNGNLWPKWEWEGMGKLLMGMGGNGNVYSNFSSSLIGTEGQSQRQK